MLLSGLLRTYNEEANLQKSLDNLFHFCDEVVISDGGSTDGTREIAESYKSSGHNVIWLDFPGGSISDEVYFNHAGDQLNFGYNHCKGKWVLTNDVDILHCDYLQAHMRRILKETPHDALYMYGVHLIGDWDHYAVNMGTGPGLIQTWQRKEGVRFHDWPEHAAYVDDYPWSSAGITRGGVFHWGYIDRQEELAKIALRHTAIPEDDTYKTLSEKPPEYVLAPVPWESCHANCTICWMEQIAMVNLVSRATQRYADVIKSMEFTKGNLRAAKVTKDAALIQMQTDRLEEVRSNLGPTSRFRSAVLDRYKQLTGS